jgi:hypothetical protein
MTISRYLLTVLGLATLAAPVFAQPRGRGMANSGDLVPSVRPVNAEEAVEMPPTFAQPPERMPAVPSAMDRMPGSNAIEYMTPRGDAFGGQPANAGAAIPKGSYPSPYYTDGPGCCGPLGRDGRVGYELYSYTGVSLVFGDGLADRLKAGWMIGGGVRTQLFNPTHDAAWTFDFGGSYSYNRGQGTGDAANIFLRTPPQQNPINGQVVPQADRLVFTAIRGVHRSSFNYAFGRDVWLWGDGSTAGMNGTNVRVGAWLGGRYGTSHVDLVPLNEVNGYSRRQNVFHGITVGTHATCDLQMGAWIWTTGLRVEYGHDWTNLVPPLQGNIHWVNIQFTTGIRY